LVDASKGQTPLAVGQQVVQQACRDIVICCATCCSACCSRFTNPQQSGAWAELLLVTPNCLTPLKAKLQ